MLRYACFSEITCFEQILEHSKCSAYFSNYCCWHFLIFAVTWHSWHHLSCENSLIVCFLNSILFILFRTSFYFYLHGCLSTWVSAKGIQDWIRFPGPGIAEVHSCAAHCRCWEPNLGPREEQLVLLTADSPLQPPCSVFLHLLIHYPLLLTGYLRVEHKRLLLT